MLVSLQCNAVPFCTMQCHSVLCSTSLHHMVLQYAVGSVCAAGSLDLIALSVPCGTTVCSWFRVCCWFPWFDSPLSLGPRYLWDSIRSISRTLQSVKLTQNYILAAQLPPSTHRSEDTRTVVIAWVLSCCSFVSLHTVLYRVYRAVLAWKKHGKKERHVPQTSSKVFFQSTFQ